MPFSLVVHVVRLVHYNITILVPEKLENLKCFSHISIWPTIVFDGWIPKLGEFNLSYSCKAYTCGDSCSQFVQALRGIIWFVLRPVLTSRFYDLFVSMLCVIPCNILNGVCGNNSKEIPVVMFPWPIDTLRHKSFSALSNSYPTVWKPLINIRGSTVIKPFVNVQPLVNRFQTVSTVYQRFANRWTLTSIARVHTLRASYWLWVAFPLDHQVQLDTSLQVRIGQF